MKDTILVDRLDDYNISVGDKVYVLAYPNAKTSKYSYKEATIIRIEKNVHMMEKPNEFTRHYKAKLKMWQQYQNKDECDRCKFTINCAGDSFCREIKRKYLYTQEEFDILLKDIDNLNKVYDFKKLQEEQFKSFITKTFDDWDYDNFENQRRKEDTMKERICPRCGNPYYDYPAISRKDNKTEICSTCGQAEALLQYAGKDLTNDKWKLEK